MLSTKKRESNGEMGVWNIRCGNPHKFKMEDEKTETEKDMQLKGKPYLS